MLFRKGQRTTLQLPAFRVVFQFEVALDTSRQDCWLEDENGHELWLCDWPDLGMESRYKREVKKLPTGKLEVSLTSTGDVWLRFYRWGFLCAELDFDAGSNTLRLKGEWKISVDITHD